jgi:phage shock protein C
MERKLYRDEYHKVLGGVCAGLAEYFDMDPTIVRLLFAFTFFVMGAGLIPYIILWIVLPKKGYVYNSWSGRPVDYRVPPQQPAGEPSASQSGHSSPYGSNPFGNNPFSNNPYENSSYGNSPFMNRPYESDPLARPQQRSHAGIIIGVVLILIGGIVLLDNYDWIPDIDFERVWPAILVVVGASLIVSGQSRKNWMHSNFSSVNKQED